MISISMWFRLSKMGSRLMFIIGLGHRISGHIERRQELRKSRLFSRPIPLYCDGGAAGACSHSRRCNERNHILSEARLEWIAKSKGENIRFFIFIFAAPIPKYSMHKWIWSTITFEWRWIANSSDELFIFIVGIFVCYYCLVFYVYWRFQ